jgi:hypothetical protein
MREIMQINILNGFQKQLSYIAQQMDLNMNLLVQSNLKLDVLRDLAIEKQWIKSKDEFDILVQEKAKEVHSKIIEEAKKEESKK